MRGYSSSSSIRRNRPRRCEQRRRGGGIAGQRAVEWREEALTRQHNRGGFDCGVAALNEYLQRDARQNHESGGAKTFVAVLPKSPTLVLGIEPGTPLDVRVRDGVIEITPHPLEVTLERRGRWLVARAAQPVPPLTQDLVHRTLQKLRRERGR